MEKMLERPNLREQVYDIVRNMIILREIMPGEKINEEELASRLGVSRTPIRETLCRLENEGIVQTIPRRGAFVAKQSKEKVIEILQIREVLEGLVARLATRNMDQTTLNQLRESLRKISSVPDEKRHLVKYTRADVEFHSLVVDACQNQMLQNMMEIVNAHLQIIRLRTVVLPGRAKKTVQEHYQILEAIEKNDPKAAEELMRKHVESVRNDAIRNIEAML